MAALPAGVQYALSSESSYHENKDLVFVKLTDSALKAIEDFIRNSRGKGAVGSTPTIQFLQGNEGKISIPSNGANGVQAPSTFLFSLSGNADMEGQGSFECVRGGGGGGRRLDSCGPMPRKMRVHAKEDVYETTRARFTADEEQQKNKRARVIKPNQTDIGRRVTGRVRPTSNGMSASVAGSRQAAQVAPAPAPARKAPTSPPASAALTSPAAPLASAPLTRQPAPATRQIPQPAPTATPRQIPQPAPATPAPPQAPAAPQQKPPGNPDLMRRPIKERLIQLLALRPYKKPELYLRIASEGVREKEKGVMNNILQQISCLKDNCYQLHRHLWNDVNEDWPFYTEEEKQFLKRRKPQNLTPPLSSDSGQSLSPRASPPASSSSKRGAGGGASVCAEAGTTNIKKQRISHYNKPSPAASSGYSGSASSGGSSGERREYSDEEITSVPHPPHANTPGKKENGYTLNFVCTKDSSFSPAKQTDCRTTTSTSSPIQQHSPENDSNSQPDDIEAMENMFLPENEMPDSLDCIRMEREYPAIQNTCERRQYKAVFAAHYKEYRDLYSRVASVDRLFTQLETRLRREVPGSVPYQDIQQQIVEEYQRTKSDPSYEHARLRFASLHHKLTHIKRMVHDYDRRKNVSTRVATAAY